MDLTTQPWIPIIKQNGIKELVSLMAVFQQGDNIRDLAVNPPQRIALMRLLICIVQAALDGPENEKDWQECKGKITEATSEYLKKWQDRFNLYGDKPFLQATNIEPLNNATIDKLDFDLAAGNNFVLFDHEANPLGREHSSAWCALRLLTYLCFSPGGLIGTTKWGRQTTKKTSEHAPAIEGSALHTYIRGKDLNTTTWLNLSTMEMIKSQPGMQFGRPVWENAALAAGSTAEFENHIKSYLGRLVPFSRGIVIDQNKQKITLVNGLAYPKIPQQREISATVIRRGKGQKEKDMYIAVNLTRHPWRELASVLSLQSRDVIGGALALKHLKYKDHLKIDMIDIWTGGIAANKGKIVDIGEWNFALPLQMLEDLKKYEDGVAMAQTGEFNLKMAVKEWHVDMKVAPKQISYAKAQIHYWSELDTQYQILIDTAEKRIPLNEHWYGCVRKAMGNAFNRACPHTTARQIQAYTKARQKLRLKKAEE